MYHSRFTPFPSRLIPIAALPVILTFFSCGSGSPSGSGNPAVSGEFSVSGCGGFTTERRVARSAQDTTETLRWTYTPQNRTLTVQHAGVQLNCCGERTVSALRDGEILVITESDRSPEGGRCRCLCRFDFSAAIPDISPGSLRMRLELAVDSTLVRSWSGTLDLDRGSGEIRPIEASGISFRDGRLSSRGN